MPLSSEQYDSIMLEYDKKKNRSAILYQERSEEVRRKVPHYEETENAIIDLSMKSFLDESSDPESSDRQLLHKSLMELGQKKTELLKAAGYPEDYLDDIYECRLCRDTGYLEGGVMCSCLRHRINKCLYKYSNLSTDISRDNFSTLSYEYHSGEDLVQYRRAVAIALNFVKYFPRGESLLLFGPVGTGKTFLTNCIAKELVDRGFNVLYFSADRLISGLRVLDSWTKSEETELAKNIYSCDLLIVDDLGTEHITSYSLSKLFDCLNSRLQKNLSTIISTNHTLETLRDKYSERIFSRISSSYTACKLSGADIRFQKLGL